MGFYTEKGHEYIVYFRCGFIFVDIRRHAALNIEEIVGVTIDFICRRCRKTNDKRVEVFENCPILLKNGAMRLVDNDEVEMGRREHAVTIFVSFLVDSIHDGRIGGKNNARITFIFVRAKVA